VKWPNDIYVNDCKIGGILIENTLRGQYIDRCIIGCGVNINQATFHSDAPNPVSLRQLLGHDVERRFVLEAIIDNFNHHYSSLQSSETTAAATEIHSAYLAALYRRQGLHPYRLPSSPTPFLAEIADVQPSGHLILRDPSGALHRFAFKEVSFDYSED
jgi:BirA family biotin operon repressor/biotin-[acetyl-CoA-carboxylase] ligase